MKLVLLFVLIAYSYGQAPCPSCKNIYCAAVLPRCPRSQWVTTKCGCCKTCGAKLWEKCFSGSKKCIRGLRCVHAKSGCRYNAQDKWSVDVLGRCEPEFPNEPPTPLICFK